MRKYTINKEYFDYIDSHEKSYWLGFISADAHLFSGGGVVAGIQLELAEKDLLQLQRFRDAISSNAPIRQTVHGKYKEYRIMACSTYIAKSLMKYGLTQNKSHTLPFPRIPEEYYSSYVLGYFDGDGSITLVNGTKPRVQFLGGYNFLDSLGDVLHQIPGVNKSTIHPGSGIYRILYGGRNQVKSIRDWMYRDFDLPLDRKRSVFFSI